MNSLRGKTAIITGASGGIGRAIAKAFGAQGASKLYLLGRNETELQATEKLIQEESPETESSIVRGNVGSSTFWRHVDEEYGRHVDILVNAAGVAHASLLSETPISLIENVYEANLLGPTLSCRVFARRFLRQNRKGERSASNPAYILNVASLLGIKGGRGSAAYAASKAGVIALTRSLAAEIGAHNVRVNVLVPGYITTNMTQTMSPKTTAIAESSTPMKRFGTPEEVAHAAVFLCTNPYANNTVLNLDGGLSAT